MKKILYILIPILIAFLACFLIFGETDKKYYTEVSPSNLSKLIKSKQTMIVFFKKDGCNHCEQVKPIINDYAKSKKIKVYSITISKYKNMEKISDEYDIPGTPVVSYYENGKVKSRLIGGFTIKQFKNFLNKQGLR